MGYFDAVKKAPLDPIFGLSEAFQKDPREDKVNLSIGIYTDEEGKTPIMEAVSLAENFLAEKKESKVYLPIGGDPEYNHLVAELVFGSLFAKHSHRIAVLQTIGGTGALSIGAHLLRCHTNLTKAVITKPSWPNHKGVFTQAGFQIEEVSYPENYLEKLTHITDSIVVHHASCHNPTGYKMKPGHWQALLEIAQKNRQFCFFDAAYLGFGTSFAIDAEALHLWLLSGTPFACALSFSKNFSLYGERAGALFIVTEDKEAKERVESQAKINVRTTYSNPPCHPSFLVKAILQNPTWKNLWEKELTSMRQRIESLRLKLSQNGFAHLTSGEGMFAFTNLSEAQVTTLLEEFGIYMTHDGRINLAGLNARNFPRVIKALHAV